MDDNLRITEQSQKAAAQFLSVFNSGNKAVFDATMTAKREELNAVNTVANYRLNVLNTNSLIRSRNLRDQLAVEAEKRAKEVFAFEKERNELLFKADELKVKREQQLLDDAAKESVIRESRAFIQSRVPDLISDARGKFINSNNIEFINGFESITSKAQSRILDGEDPAEVERQFREEYKSLIENSDFTAKQPFSKETQLKIKSLDPDLANEYALRNDPELSQSRNALDSQILNPRVTANAFNDYLEKHPERASELGKYKNYQNKILSQAASLEERITILRKLASDSKLSDEQLSSLREMESKLMEVTNSVYDIPDAVNEGKSFSDFIKSKEEAKEAQAEIVKQASIPSPEARDLIDRNLKTEGSLDSFIGSSNGNTEKFLARTSSALQSIKISDGSLSDLLNPLEFGVEDWELDASFFDPFARGYIDDTADEKIRTKIKKLVDGFSDSQIIDIITKNKDVFPDIVFNNQGNKIINIESETASWSWKPNKKDILDSVYHSLYEKIIGDAVR